MRVKDKLTYSGSYERTIYHQSKGDTSDLIDENIANPFVNNIGIGLSYDFKYLYTSLDYSFLFGDDETHRLRWNITGYLKKKNLLFFDYILFTPDFSLLFGQEDILLTTFNLREQLQQTDKEQLFQDIADLGFTRETFRALSDRQKQFIIRALLTPESSVFGLMNFGLSIPLVFRTGSWSYTISYNYNVPVELPGEELSLSPSGYLGLSLTYYLGF